MFKGQLNQRKVQSAELLQQATILFVDNPSSWRDDRTKSQPIVTDSRPLSQCDFSLLQVAFSVRDELFLNPVFIQDLMGNYLWGRS